MKFFYKIQTSPEFSNSYLIFYPIHLLLKFNFQYFTKLHITHISISSLFYFSLARKYLYLNVLPICYSTSHSTAFESSQATLKIDCTIHTYSHICNAKLYKIMYIFSDDIALALIDFSIKNTI